MLRIGDHEDSDRSHRPPVLNENKRILIKPEFKYLMQPNTVSKITKHIHT